MWWREQGLGAIVFAQPANVFLWGSAALSLFDSGFHTSLKNCRNAATPALALATVGVAITTVVVAVAAHWLLKWDDRSASARRHPEFDRRGGGVSSCVPAKSPCATACGRSWPEASPAPRIGEVLPKAALPLGQVELTGLNLGPNSFGPPAVAGRWRIRPGADEPPAPPRLPRP